MHERSFVHVIASHHLHIKGHCTMSTHACALARACAVKVGESLGPGLCLMASLLRIAREHHWAVGRNLSVCKYYTHANYLVHSCAYTGLNALHRNTGGDLVIRGGVCSRAGRADVQQRLACTVALQPVLAHDVIS